MFKGIARLFVATAAGAGLGAGAALARRHLLGGSVAEAMVDVPRETWEQAPPPPPAPPVIEAQPPPPAVATPPSVPPPAPTPVVAQSPADVADLDAARARLRERAAALRAEMEG